MAFKILSLFGLVSMVLAVERGSYNNEPNNKENERIYVYPRQRVESNSVYAQNDYHEQFAPAAYDFNYQVHDEHIGDIKSQKEVRNGDAVQGRYELIDSDGFRRIVEYTADSHNGFVAIVHREPVDFKIPQPTVQEQKLRYLAPVIKNEPVQAYPVQKTIFELPKYSAAQFLRVPQPSIVQGYNAEAAPASAYQSPVHSAALQNGVGLNQYYQNPQNLLGELEPVRKQNVGNQGNAIPAQPETQIKYNTIAYSVPSNNQHINAALTYNTRNNNHGHYLVPLPNNYYSAPISPRGPYSAPLANEYSDHMNSVRNYYYTQEQNRIPLDYSGYNVVPSIQTKLTALNREQSGQGARIVSVLPKLDARQNGYIVSTQHDPTPQNSESNLNQKQEDTTESFGASTTPSYKQ